MTSQNSGNKWSLSGRRAIITGATSGIGLAIATEFASLGVEVCLVARNEEKLLKTISTMTLAGYNVWGRACDVSDEEQRISLQQHVVQRWSSLDILVNNVGTNIRKKTMEYTALEFQNIFRTNLESAFSISRACYPLLKSTGNASIVHISSVAAQTALGTGAPYAMMKAALEQFTRYTAVEWAPDGIRVNAIAPWYIQTPLVQTMLDNEEFYKRVILNTPLGRVGTPEEIAGLTVFLCMDKASFITGQTIAVDGGFLSKGFV